MFFFLLFLIFVISIVLFLYFIYFNYNIFLHLYIYIVVSYKNIRVAGLENVPIAGTI